MTSTTAIFVTASVTGTLAGGPACRQAGVVDETGETVALATILTMVKKLDQS